MDISQYLDLFISEAQDHIQQMNQTLLALEQDPNDLGQLDAFFRAAHSLKGMSATLGFQRMATLSHEVEDLLDLLRKRERLLTPELADILFRSLDVLTETLQRIVAGEGDQVDIEPIQALLRQAKETPAPPAPSPPAARPERGWTVRVEIAPDCALKGARAFLVLKRLREIATVLGSDPAEEDLRAGDYESAFEVFLSPEADPGAAEEAATSVAEVAAATVGPLAPGGAAPGAVAPGAVAPEVTAPEVAIPEAVAPPVGAPRAGAEPTAAIPTTPLVRIKVALLDQLLEAVAQLVINRSHLVQLAQRYALPDLDEVVEVYTRAMEHLQETVLTMRMTPVGHVFNRFPRMVRDVAHQQGKQVRFEMEGLELELDRTILEKITDPLVHILRNAVDHGIEPPPERRQAGKSPEARIVLQARRERDTAVIEVRDDGQGMSASTIAQVAVERGMITEQEAADMDEATRLELICQPGFSTRAEVTGVSGRGVGMGVVKQAMDEIGGDLEIESEPGQGSCFRLRFPLTIAILPALMVRTGEETYALPLTHVARSLEPLPSEINQLQTQPFLWWEEEVLPLTPLATLIGGEHDQVDVEQEEPLSVVLVERGRQRHGLIVDEILGKEEIVLKPLEGMLQQIEGLAGATIRGAGEVTLVLDIPSLVRLAAQRADTGSNKAD